MIIKELVVGSLFSMLLVSEMALADWGDVYYCQMTNFNEITLEGEKKSYKLQTFQFKLDQTKNAMVFGSTGYLQNEVYELIENFGFPHLENWWSTSAIQTTSFDNGKFLFTANNTYRIASISADCDKF